MAPSSFGAQARALTAKSWAYQSRKRCQNCCLILLPLIFMALLAILQSLINTAIANAGLTCAKTTVVTAACSGIDGSNCSSLGPLALATILGACADGSTVESNVVGSGKTKSSQCVYPPQIGSMVLTDDSVSFNLAMVIVTEEEKPVQTNVMSPEDVQQKLMDSGKFSSVTSASEPDVANSRSRSLPFCPIAHPEPFPPFLLTPKPEFRDCMGSNSPDSCATFLGTGGTAGYEAASMLPAVLASADFDRTISVFLEGVLSGAVDPNFLAAFLGAGTGGGPRGGGSDGSVFNAASLLSSGGQSQLLPLLADGFAGLTLGSPAVPTSQLFLDNAFSTPDQYRRRRLSHNNGPDLTAGSGLYVLANSCPELKASIRASTVPIICEPPSEPCNASDVVWTSPELSPAIPLVCVNITTAAQSSAADIDAAIFAGYWTDTVESQNEDIREYVGGWDFRRSSADRLEVDVIFNDTNQATAGGGPPKLSRINAPLNLATVAFLERRTGGSATAKLRSLRMMPQPERSLNLDFSSLLGPLFYVWLLQLLFPVGLAAIVYEKEHRLRMMIKMMGMNDRAFWLVTYLWNLLLYCIFAVVLYAGGNAIGLAFFTINNAVLQFAFYFLYGNLQIAWTILVSTIFSSTKTATVASYLWVFLSGLVANVLLPFFLQSTVVPSGLVTVLQLIPAFSLYRGLYEFAQYAFEGAYKETSGMTFDSISDDINGLPGVMLIMLIEWPLFLLLAFYLDQVLDAGTGVRRPWNYCFSKSSPPHQQGELTKTNGADSSKVGAVLATNSKDVVIEAVGLTKVWPSSNGNPAKTAVENVDLKLHKQECFGLLGQNGAGKTTTIMMLCGFTELSDGEAVVAGFDVRTDMQRIYECMGVCPQHNLLWETLTALEHVRFYATLKGVPKASVQSAAMEALQAVSLASVAGKRAGEFSGGMKRRLSVAISLIGDPTVVFMDEPSTGLDPASRKQLWRTVHAAKSRGGCGIILTTHSMQEAEELCDRLCIIRGGKTVVEGTPLSLTKSYGDYLQVNLNLPPNRLDDATELLKDLSPSMTLKEGLGGTQKYELLGNETNVQAVLKTIIEHKDRLEIEDWGVQNASLEDVFVRMYGADADGEHEGSNESPLGALNDARAEQKRRQHTGELSCKEELSNFGRHSRVLLRKNIKIAARSRGATFGQVTASFFFMFFVWVVDQAVVAQRSSESRYQTVRTPDRDPIESIPLCEPIREGACYTFAYSPIGLPLVESVVASIRSNNDPVIAPDGIIGFASGVEADAYALAHPETISGAVHFFVEGSSKVNFELQFNSSVVFSRGKFDNPERKYAVPLQHAVERALIRYHLDDPALPIDVAVREFAHPAFRGGSIVGRVGAPFFFAGAMFSFVITIGAVVSERETKLRQAMEGMGLQRAGFWFTWLLFELCMVTLSSLCMIFFGVVLQFDLFLKNAFLLSFLLIFLFQLSMLGLAFLLSTMTNKSASATTIGFMVFLFGFVVQLVVGFGFPFTEEYNSGWQTAFALFPPSLLAKGLGDLGKYTAREESVGLDWAERHSYCEDEELCTMSLAEIYEWFVFTFFLYLTLALYFDRVMPDDGVTLPPWFCLSPGYWCKSKSIQEDRTAEDFGEPDDDDVAAESGRIKARVGSAMNPEAAVEIRGLTKKFGSCYSRKKPFHAVKGPWYEIRKNELFCLLGPNGAGKTTTINMLVGNLPPTSGEALQLGESIRSPAGMDLIRRRIGVCPQFDVQWGQLTAYEHLHLFGTLKGLAGDSVALHAEIIQRLLQVGLVKKEPWLVGVHNGAPQIKVGTGTRVATFSGGEKRRLSVAMALMGEPDLLYLDEPTTGMDPISRREVWNLIHACKDPVAHPGRAIVLTTHSMEEAEILSDRVAIMARGSMRCIGSSLRLKQKFGASFAVAIGVKSHQTGADVAAAFGSIGVDPDKASGRTDASNGRTRTPPETPGEVDPPNVVNVASVNVAESISADAKLQVLRFTVPRGKETELVALMEKVRGIAGVEDVTLRLNTLEAVFLQIAKDAEIEAASVDPSRMTVKIQVEHASLDKGVAKVDVKIGCDRDTFELKTADGGGKKWFVCFVEWGQDEDGEFSVIESRVEPATSEDLLTVAQIGV